MCPTCSRSLRASCLTCSRASGVSCLALVPHGPRVLRALVPHVPGVYVLLSPSCYRTLRDSCSTCPRVSRDPYLACSCASSALVAHMLSCLTWPSCFVPCVLHVPISPFLLLLFHASRDFFLFPTRELFSKFTAVKIKIIFR